jgi:hypothetical protein
MKADALNLSADPIRAEKPIAVEHDWPVEIRERLNRKKTRCFGQGRGSVGIGCLVN